MKKSTSWIDMKYILVIAIFVIGIIFGSVVANKISINQVEQLKIPLDNFIKNYKVEEIEWAILLQFSFIKYLKIILVVWILGMFSFGTLFIYGYIGYKGFGYGFTSAFIIKQLGMKGFWISFLGYFPPNLIFLPMLSILVILSIENTKGKDKKERVKNDLLERNKIGRHLKRVSYPFVLLFYMVFISICSLIETFITPLLLRLVIGS